MFRSLEREFSKVNSKSKFIYHVKYTQKDTSNVIPIEDVPYIKYKKSATSES